MKYFYLLYLFYFLTTINASNIGEIDYSEVIQLANKQRLLSQQISSLTLLNKNYFENTAVNETLARSITLFETNHKNLLKSISNKNSKTPHLLKEVEEKWFLFKRNVLIFEKESVISLLNSSKSLLFACNDLALELETEASFSSMTYSRTENTMLQISTLNIAAEQPVLAQQFCFYYMVTAFYQMSDIFKPELNSIRQKQRDDLSFLITNSINNEVIEEQFKEVTLLFELLDKYQNLQTENSLSKVISFCNRITNLFDKITNNYIKSYKVNNDINTLNFSTITLNTK